MIRLKNGDTVSLDADPGEFFRTLLKSILKVSREEIENRSGMFDSPEEMNGAFLQELMENCMHVAVQILDLSEKNRDLGETMVSSFIFSNILAMMQDRSSVFPGFDPEPKEKKPTIH